MEYRENIQSDSTRQRMYPLRKHFFPEWKNVVKKMHEKINFENRSDLKIFNEMHEDFPPDGC